MAETEVIKGKRHAGNIFHSGSRAGKQGARGSLLIKGGKPQKKRTRMNWNFLKLKKAGTQGACRGPKAVFISRRRYSGRASPRGQLLGERSGS